MNERQAMEAFTKIFYDYQSIRDPKYRYANLEDLKDQLVVLYGLKDDLNEIKNYHDLINGITQTIRHIERNAKSEKPWINVSERGINKAIQPVVKKAGHPVEFPFEWKDPKSGRSCYINDNWDARNFMVMDVVGYMLLLKEGGDALPKEPSFIFNDLSSIGARESIPSPESSDDQDQMSVLTRILSSRFWIKFTDSDFKKFTCRNYTSTQILNLLHDTSKVEFKIVFPIRIMEKEGPKEKICQMNIFSRPFELWPVDKDIRNDGIVQSREYYILFNTVLGELFVHNLLSKNYDWIENRFYMLPAGAQVFYRQFIIHNNYPQISLNLSTIKERLHLCDKNTTNLIRTIEDNILKPLRDHDFIDSCEKTNEGLMDTKFIIHRSKKGNQADVIDDIASISTEGSGVRKGGIGGS